MRRAVEAAAFGGLALGLHIVALAALPGPPPGGAPAREGAPISVTAPDAALRSLVASWDATPEVSTSVDDLAELETPDMRDPMASQDIVAAALPPLPTRPDGMAPPVMPRDPAARPPAPRPKARPLAASPAAPGASGTVRTTAAAPAPGPSSAALERGLAAEVRAALARAQRYPDRARARGVTGTAVLDVAIGRDGRLVASRIATGSGSDALDRAALAAAERAAFPAAPPGLAGSRFTFRVALDFRLR